MSRSNSWKKLESMVAEALGGIRIHRGGDFSESLPDAIAPGDATFKTMKPTHGIIVECKYRADQPWINKYKKLLKSEAYRKHKYLLLALDCTNAISGLPDLLCLTPLEYFNKIEDPTTFPYMLSRQRGKVPGYLHEYCSQSRMYINDLDIRDSIQLLYYKATKDRTRPPFTSFSSMAVIGQKNDKLRLACFYQSEFKVLEA